MTPLKDVVDCAEQLSVPRKKPSRPGKMLHILTPSLNRRKLHWGSVKGSGCAAVKAILSMASIQVLDGFGDLTKRR